MLSDRAVAHLGALSDWPDLSGTRYRALEELGRGGMGLVLRARDERLDREVALKVLRTADAPAALAQRLGREAKILARLEHPGIVPVHDSGSLPDGRIFYVMKLVRGQRLDRWLGGNPTERERLDLLRRVAETVAFAHANGVIHRDLKPANIMVGEFGEVLVLDWGVARLRETRESAPADGPETEEDTGHGTVLGTAGFMAPEQASGAVELIDQRTDVYGLGALLGTLIHPLPRRLAAVAGRAMEIDRDRRYPSALALARELVRFQDGEPLEAYRESVVEKVERVVAKYRTPIVLVLAYLLMRAAFLIASGR
jgi:serine/threonine protein kinase